MSHCGCCGIIFYDIESYFVDHILIMKGGIFWNHSFFFYELNNSMVRILHLEQLRNKYAWMNADDPCLCCKCITDYHSVNEIRMIKDDSKICAKFALNCCFFCADFNVETYLIQTENTHINHLIPSEYYYIYDYDFCRFYFHKLPSMVEPDITHICDDCLEILIHFGDIKLSRDIPYSIPPNFIYGEFNMRDSDVLFPYELFEPRYAEYYQYMHACNLRRHCLNNLGQVLA